MNERGSSLVIVLLIALIFSVLGLSVLGAAVNNVKRTEIRGLEIETTASGKVLMSEVIAKLQENLDNSGIEIELKGTENPSPSYNSKIQMAITSTKDAFTGVTIEKKDKVYEKYGITNVTNFEGKNFLRIYEITIDNEGTESNNPTINRKVTQNVILSPTPSFLNYAVGSTNTLIINGSPDIIGNVYAPTIELNSKANYIKNNISNPTGDFQGPSIFGTLYTKKLENSGQPSNPTGKSFYPFFNGEFNEKADGIIGIPAIKATSSNFVDMDFDETFYLKWGESGAPNLTAINPDYDDLDCSGDKLYKALDHLDALVENDPSPTATIDDINDYMEEDEKIKTEGNPRYLNPKFTCKRVKDGKPFYLIEESMLETYSGYKSNLFITDVENTSNTIFFTNIDRYDPDSPGSTERRLLNTYTKNKDSAIEDDKNPKPNILKIGGLKLDGSENDLILKNGNDKGWLVVNGSLEINGSEDPLTAPTIKGNILVNGDLYIRSTNAEVDTDPKEYIKFDATIYVRGETIIDNVNIKGAMEGTDEKQLVLISNNDLKIVRVNEYEDVSNEKSLVKIINEKPNLKGFFYTNKNATLYGVGSHFQIEGGVFAREQLTINAIRYNFTSKGLYAINEAQHANYSSNTGPNEGLRSRFYVEYDNRVITDQLSSLPKVNRLQVIADDLVIN